MLNRNLFAVALAVTVCSLASTVHADDDLLTRLASTEASENVVESNEADIDENDFGVSDVESLLAEDGEEASSEEAVAACYRRATHSYGYRSYGHRSYYSSYYTPRYHHSYSYYSPSYCYTPVTYSYYTPVYTNYWGCW